MCPVGAVGSIQGFQPCDISSILIQGIEEVCMDDDMVLVPKALVQAHVDEILMHMKSLTPKRRLEIIHEFCVHCGDDGPTCCCSYDC